MKEKDVRKVKQSSGIENEMNRNTEEAEVTEKIKCFLLLIKGRCGNVGGGSTCVSHNNAATILVSATDVCQPQE